jgi:hypothetical protein
MAEEINDTTTPHELRIQMDENGVPRGQVQYRRKIVVDGKTIYDEVQPAQALTFEQGPGGDWIEAVLGETLRAALTHLEGFQADLEAATKVNEGLAQERDFYKAVVDRARHKAGKDLNNVDVA